MILFITYTLLRHPMFVANDNFSFLAKEVLQKHQLFVRRPLQLVIIEIPFPN